MKDGLKIGELARQGGVTDDRGSPLRQAGSGTWSDVGGNPRDHGHPARRAAALRARASAADRQDPRARPKAARPCRRPPEAAPDSPELDAPPGDAGHDLPTYRTCEEDMT